MPRLSAFALALVLATGPVAAQDRVLNLYSARHYQTDDALYANFTKATGIRVNRIEAGDDQLIERVRNEGSNSPADVIMFVDAARLYNAQQMGLFQPLKSAVLESRIPAELRDAQGHWFAFSTRARVIVFNKAELRASDVATYEQLADPGLKGKVCTRSGSHPYMLSLVAAMTEHMGEARAEAWARGVVGNFARKPAGGDTDQVTAVAAGQCGVALTNTYYLVRMLKSNRPQDREVMSKVGVVWPNQAGWGTHLNVSGAGVARNSPNRDAAVRFLEYLASDDAQRYFADGNNEWPTVRGVKVKNDALASLGEFKADTLGAAVYGRLTPVAQRIVDRSGWR
jgi:iron(III) transport system substrate-binding protein